MIAREDEQGGCVDRDHSGYPFKGGFANGKTEIRPAGRGPRVSAKTACNPGVRRYTVIIVDACPPAGVGGHGSCVASTRRGSSSGVEHHVANVVVVGSN